MIETFEKKNLKCYHCGDHCSGEEIRLEEKIFCCNGCKTVYEILKENALCEYYQFQEAPGNKTTGKSLREYAFLDEEKIKNDLLNFQEGNTSGITFYIPLIHCSSCIWLLENLHKIHPGIMNASIQFQKKELDVQFDSSKISLGQLAILLDSLGYPPEITLNGKAVNRSSVNKSLLYKIGVAGFCFGNIMLLSIPDYVSFFNDFGKEYKVFFSYLNLLLAIPVFFYSASDYFLSSWGAIKNRMINIDLPIAMALAAAFGQSVWEIISQTGMGYLDSLTGLIFFLLIGKWYQRKTYEALSFERDYKSYFPLAIALLKEGKEFFVPINELNPGDLMVVRNQDVIPADGILKDGDARIDYSFVTGESVPVHKKVGERIFAGGRQVGANIQVEVVKKVSESYLTQLWNKDQGKKTAESALTLFTDKVGKYFTAVIILTALVTYAYWRLHNPSIALHSLVSVLIIFCPCTLALAIPFCFGNAMNILSKNGLYLKNTETIERLADNTDIVFDKTGTITHTGEAEMEFEGFLSPEEKIYVKSLVKNSGHPLSRMLHAALKNTTEYPVQSFREETSKGIIGVIKGKEVRIGSADFVGIKKEDRRKGNDTLVFISIDAQVKGCYIFKNKYRSGITGLLQKLLHNYKLHLLSGDNDAERKNLQNYFSTSRLWFNQSPNDKLEYVQYLEKDRKTLMVGDGLNDAGALMQANCGISVSESSAHFSPACDAILEAEKLNKLPDFLKYSKACVRTVRLSLLISLAYNIIGLYFACQGLLQPLVAAILMPLSSISIVAFVTLMSNWLAKKYGLK